MSVAEWIVEKIINFTSEEFVKEGFSHFGFHDRHGNHYAISHQKHFLGLIDKNGEIVWTVAARQVIQNLPNITAGLNYPMFIDSLNDGKLVVSNFVDAKLHIIDPEKRRAELFLDGLKIGMKDAGNCVVDNDGFVWVNEVRGCKIWRFDITGKPVLTLGNGISGFQIEEVSFENARFSWIYDIRRGPDGNIYILDSKNFAIRLIDIKSQTVKTLAGKGKPGYTGDGADAKEATFGSDPVARFDGPISISLDEEGNIFVGDRMNHVVRKITRKSNLIETIAGNHDSVKGQRNDPQEKNPFKLNLPEISSMDYFSGQLFIPTDLSAEEGDLAVLRKVK